MTEEAKKPDFLGLILRVGLFILIGWLSLIFFGSALFWITGSKLITATMATFAAACLANAITVRIYERGQLSALGLGWGNSSSREFLLGAGSGAAGACLVMLLPIAAGAASFEKVPGVGAPVGQPRLRQLRAVVRRVWRRNAVPRLRVSIAGPTGRGVRDHSPRSHNLWPGAYGQSTFKPAWASAIRCYGAFYSAMLTCAPARCGCRSGCTSDGTSRCLCSARILSGFTMGVTGYALHWTAGTLWSGGDYGPEGSLLTTAIVIVLFFVLHRYTIEQNPE